MSRVMSEKHNDNASDNASRNCSLDVPHSAFLVEKSLTHSPVRVKSCPGFPHASVPLSAANLTKSGSPPPSLPCGGGENSGDQCDRLVATDAVSDKSLLLEDSSEEAGSSGSHGQIMKCPDAVGTFSSPAVSNTLIIEMSDSSGALLPTEVQQMKRLSSPNLYPTIEKEQAAPTAGLADENKQDEPSSIASSHPVHLTVVDRQTVGACSLLSLGFASQDVPASTSQQPIQLLLSSADKNACSEKTVMDEVEVSSNSWPASPQEPSILAMDVEGILEAPVATRHHSCQAHTVDEDSPIAKKAARRTRKSRAETTSSRKKKRVEKVSPNAFVSVRISSAEICSRLRAVQDGMITANERLSKVLVPIEKSHITLMVLRVDSDEDIERARQALEETAAKARVEFGGRPLSLEFLGLSSFGGRVVFTQVAEGEEQHKLGQLAAQIRSTFAEHNLHHLDGSRAFAPHLTIAKTSKGGRKDPKSIDHSVYLEFSDERFGIETITELELLSMTRPPDDSGYYHCLHKCSFT